MSESQWKLALGHLFYMHVDRMQVNLVVDNAQNIGIIRIIR